MAYKIHNHDCDLIAITKIKYILESKIQNTSKRQCPKQHKIVGAYSKILQYNALLDYIIIRFILLTHTLYIYYFWCLAT